MSARFDEKLEINGHGCLTPAGPLELADDETAKRLDVWVWQDEGSCVAVQSVFPDRTSWKITTDPDENHVGAKFKPGAATAMGLLVTKTSGGQTRTLHWTTAVLLVDEVDEGGEDHPH
jgi:hypothetical protein